MLLLCILLLGFLPKCRTSALYGMGNEKPETCAPSLSIAYPHAQVLPNNSLLTGGLEFSYLFPPNTYWRDWNGLYYGCPCLLSPCIRICQEEIRNTKQGPKEVDDDEVSLLQLQIWNNNDSNLGKIIASKHFTLFTSKPCPKKEWNVLLPDQYKLYDDGKLENLIYGTLHQTEDYCLLINNKFEDHLALFCGVPHTKEMLCDETSTCYAIRRTVVILCFIVSTLFLLLTILAYAVVPALRNLHGVTIAVYCICHLLAYFGYSAIRNIYNTVLGSVIPTDSCITIGYLTYFFLESSFFWLNIMCYDIWRTFKRDFIVAAQSSKKKIVVYSAYAFLMPLVLIGVLTTIDFTHFVPQRWKPSIGRRKGICWFPLTRLYWIYADIPIMFVLVVNLIFFISTAVNIIRNQKETSLVTGKRDTSEDQVRFKMYLHLFLITGLTWIMDLVQSLLYEHFWYLTDLMSMIQSILIFVVCVWMSKYRETFIRRSLPSIISDRFSKPPPTPTPPIYRRNIVRTQQ